MDRKRGLYFRVKDWRWGDRLVDNEKVSVRED